jgi:hypothetical protein
MGRWSHLDSDEERLPEGMTRVGYDADTQVYTYRDSDGSYWEGAPGCQYGRLHRVRSATPPLPSVHIPDDISGDEKPYVLHDYDDDSSDFDDDPASPHDHDGDNDEKKEILVSLGKAKLHDANPPPHHPALAKTLPDLPTSAGADDDKGSLMSGTTARDSLVSDATYTEQQQHKPTGLKRTGTLSRLARFLYSPTSSNGTQNVSRRATFNGDAAGVGERHGKSARLARSSTSTAAGQWPGAGASAGGKPPARKRATTFDEILGIEPRK